MSVYDNERSIVSGQQLLKRPPADVLSQEAYIRVPATSGEALPLSEEILSKHEADNFPTDTRSLKLPAQDHPKFRIRLE